MRRLGAGGTLVLVSLCSLGCDERIPLQRTSPPVDGGSDVDASADDGGVLATLRSELHGAPLCAIDGDGDGHPQGGPDCRGNDCDDSDPTIHPGAMEAGTWETERVDVITDAGEPVSFAIDRDGSAHVFYLHSRHPPAGAPYELRYATNRSGAWRAEQVEMVDGSWRLPLVVGVGPDGIVHLVYVYAMDVRIEEGRGPRLVQDATLRHATHGEDGWQIEVIETLDQLGDGLSLAIDDEGMVHVSYSNGEALELRYASNARGGWLVEIVYDKDDTGGSSVGVDAAGRAHVAYIAGAIDADGVALPAPSVRHAVKSDGRWTDARVGEVVLAADVETPATRLRASLALWEEEIHVAFPGGSLAHVAQLGGLWEQENVLDEPGYKYETASLAMDTGGALHVAFLGSQSDREGGFELGYARGATAVWSAETVIAEPHTESEAVLRLDAARRIHVVYVDGVGRVLHSVRVDSPDGVDQDCNGNP